jgi:hypothetical protein
VSCVCVCVLREAKCEKRRGTKGERVRMGTKGRNRESCL